MNTRRVSGLLSKNPLPLLKTFVATVLLAASVAASAADRTTIPPRKDYASAAAALERFIEHELQDKQLPAISVSLVDGNEIVWARGFGFADPERKIPATADTVYRIGSVSKLFTDIGIMQMVEQGQIDLDAPVQTYLPDFKPANQFSKPITLRQLMSHRSGLLREPGVGHYFDPTEPTLADTVRSINGYPLLYEPETRVKYSNAGIAVVEPGLVTCGCHPRAQSAGTTADRILRTADPVLGLGGPQVCAPALAGPDHGRRVGAFAAGRYRSRPTRRLRHDQH
jgi:CubicO group peptidase (beta-lactamase class C family)